MVAILGTPQVSQALLRDIDRVGRKYGRWTADAYFELDGAYAVELFRSRLEILPMPTMEHQDVAARIYNAIRSFVPAADRVLFAGTRIKVGNDVFREPDVVYIPADLAPFIRKQYAERAALVVEVVSEFNRDHDLETKREDYAAARIPEYWIVDPELRQVMVLTLGDDHYSEHGVFRVGDHATSALLPGFSVPVSGIFGMQ